MGCIDFDVNSISSEIENQILEELKMDNFNTDVPNRWRYIEQKLFLQKLIHDYNNPKNEKSSIVIYSKLLEDVLDVHGSLDNLWKYVLERSKPRFAKMVLHETEVSPHVHIIMQFSNIVDLEEIAILLDEIHVNIYGESEANLCSFDYSFENMYRTCHRADICYSAMGEEATAFTVKITPDLAVYLCQLESLNLREVMKDYLETHKNIEN